MREALRGASVVVIGGSSGIGLATARLAKEYGATVTIAGRNQARLDRAIGDLGDGVSGATVDVADEGAVAAFFESLDAVDHVANLAGTHVNGTLAELDTSAMRGPVDNRFWGPIHVCKYAGPRMTGGSITICTGVGVERPRKGGAIVAASAGGSEFVARAMALELAPVRVNVVRPGLIDTPLLDRMTGGRREEMIAAQAKRIPLGRVGTADEVADAIVFLMTNPYVTGSTLTIDGGVGLI